MNILERDYLDIEKFKLEFYEYIDNYKPVHDTYFNNALRHINSIDTMCIEIQSATGLDFKQNHEYLEYIMFN